MQNVTVLQRLSDSAQIQKEEHIGPLFIRSFVFISSSAVFTPHSEFLLVHRVMLKSADATDRNPRTQSEVQCRLSFRIPSAGGALCCVSKFLCLSCNIWDDINHGLSNEQK